jgi:hypothetical protein
MPQAVDPRSGRIEPVKRFGYALAIVFAVNAWRRTIPPTLVTLGSEPHGISRRS